METGTLVLAPRHVGELLDLALEIFRSRFGVFVGLSTLLWIPVRVAQPFVGIHRWAQDGRADPSIGLLFSFAFNTLAAWSVSALVNALVATLVAAEFQGRTLPVLAALRGALLRTFALLVIAFLGGVLTSAGFLCVCIPGIFFAYKLYLSPIVCVVEGTGIAESLSRSFDLSRDRIFPWIGMIVVAFLLTLPLSSISAIADDPNLRDLLIREFGVSGAFFDWAAVPFTALFMGLATAFHGVLATVWYFDCRARREGADLAARLARLSAVAPAPEVAP